MQCCCLMHPQPSSSSTAPGCGSLPLECPVHSRLWALALIMACAPGDGPAASVHHGCPICLLRSLQSTVVYVTIGSAVSLCPEALECRARRLMRT